MKKIDLIRSIAVKSNLKKEQIAIVVEGVMEAIAEALHQGESVTLVGFGKSAKPVKVIICLRER